MPQASAPKVDNQFIFFHNVIEQQRFSELKRQVFLSEMCYS